MRDASGKLERWVSINLDIDERKKAEEDRRGEEELFRKIADGVPGCICIMAPDGDDGLREQGRLNGARQTYRRDPLDTSGCSTFTRNNTKKL